MATNYAFASYSEIYDMHTEVGKTTLLGIHTPITNRHQKFLNGFFTQFKKFRYKGASLSFVPVATLPADPLNVSYEAGEPGIDPRDLTNPIIHCGMHGQHLGKYLDSIFHLDIDNVLSSMDVCNSVTDADQLLSLENAYYTALSSPNFKKSHPQHGFTKKGLHPMVYGLATNRPYAVHDASNGNYEINPLAQSTFGELTLHPGGGTSTKGEIYNEFSSNTAQTLGVERTVYGNGDTHFKYDYGQFFTNKLHSLGWLDTLQHQSQVLVNGDGDGGDVLPYVSFTGLPKVYMYFVMLPPAYKQEMYYRVIIRHFFEFREFRPVTGPFSFYGYTNGVYDGVIGNDPATASATAASIDLYNGVAEVVSEGVS